MDDLTSAMIRGADALRRDHTFPSLRASELLMGAASARGLGHQTLQNALRGTVLP